MKRFNHKEIVNNTLNAFTFLKANKQVENAYEFEDMNDGNMPSGRLEIIGSGKYIYTVYVSFYDNKYLNIKDFIISQYKEQKKLFTIPFNVIIEDRNANKAELI